MATSKRLAARIQQIALQLTLEEMDDLDEEDGDCWLDAIENRAMEIGDALTVALIQERSRDRPAPGESLCPQCGKPGRYRGPHERELISRRGPVALATPEYYCPACRKAFFPSDGRPGD